MAITREFIDEALEGFGASDILLLQNETSEIGYAIEKATQKGMGVALNPSPLDDALKNSSQLQNIDWFI
ncbi:MAG: ribokinase, partial [Oscillospiraceae bacterium]